MSNRERVGRLFTTRNQSLRNAIERERFKVLVQVQEFVLVNRNDCVSPDSQAREVRMAEDAVQATLVRCK